MEIVFAKRILNTLDSGFLIVDANLKIEFWNKWLHIQTGKLAKEVEGEKLDEVFELKKVSSIKRKIKTVLAMKSTVFYNAHSANPLIEIDRPNITNSVFYQMKQKVTISPYDTTEGLVCINIVDQTLLHEANYKLEQNVANLEKLSTTDYLTKIFNRNKFYERINHEINMSKRHEIDLSLIFFDIDYLKKINDTFGHKIGDEVLVKVVEEVSSYLRETDTFARWGGEEFVILLPGSNSETAHKLADKYRVIIENIKFSNENIKVTSSFGVSSYIQGEKVEEFFSRADKALYQAKANGRNMVV